MISAKVICASVSPHYAKPLVTFKLRYPTFIHGEFMTHRVFSRNASSSRAVPVSKNIEEVRSEDRAAPVFWGAEQKGMSPGAELSGMRHPGADRLSASEGGPGSERYTLYGVSSPKDCAKGEWEIAAMNAANQAEVMIKIGVHKSIVNRVMEPFLHINVICSATEYDNFFGLRLDKAADPTMRALAEAMWREYNECKPVLLQPGEWHLPFVTDEDRQTKRDRANMRRPSREECAGGMDYHDKGVPFHLEEANNLIKVSVARCARVSYESFETGKRSTVEEDLKLYERLVGAQPLHASPAEHQCTPDTGIAAARGAIAEDGRIVAGDDELRLFGDHHSQWGNLVGWRMYRKMIPGEAVAPLPPEYPQQTVK